AGGANDLAAASGLELDVVHRAADRNVGQWQRIAGFDVGFRPTRHGIADRQADRGQDVALLAVGIGQQRDPGATVRVVLDGADRRRDVQLVALEVDEAVELAVAAALMAYRDLSLGIATGVRLHRNEQPLLRLLASPALLEGVGDGQRDLGLGRLRVNPKQVLAGRHRGVALLTDQWALHHVNSLFHVSHSSTWVSAERVKTTVSAVSTSLGLRLVPRMVL